MKGTSHYIALVRMGYRRTSVWHETHEHLICAITVTQVPFLINTFLLPCSEEM